MFILEALYFFLPAYIANMAPVFAARIFGATWQAPIDGGAMFQGKRVLGDHKTWRGLAAGILLAVATVYLQDYLAATPLFDSVSIVSYSSTNLVLLGILFGFGALFGDAIKSFFKRQIGIRPGRKWPVFDQLDFVIGALAFVSFVFVPGIQHILTLLIISPLLHVLTNIIGYYLKLKEHPW